MEINPYSALTHMAALAYHGLTDEPVHTIHAVILAPRIVFDGDPCVAPLAYLQALRQDRTLAVLPTDTRPSDWEDRPTLWVATPPHILEWPVEWDRSGRFFDIEDDRRHGYTVRVTSQEKTLLDGLQKPQLCGGIETVLSSWARARNRLDLDKVVQDVEQLGVAVLRQRVGYIADELGLSHPSIEAWRSRAQRGGSSRLVAAAPYAPTYSERWNLSLNAPTTSLRDLVPEP